MIKIIFILFISFFSFSQKSEIDTLYRLKSITYRDMKIEFIYKNKILIKNFYNKKGQLISTVIDEVIEENEDED